MKTLHEIFTEIQDSPTRAERQEILKENNSFSLRTILQLNFNKDIKLELPTGKPPYTCDEEPYGKPEQKIKQLGKCAVGSGTNSIKKEKIFIEIVESLTEKDANIVCLAKDGNIMKEYSRVSESLVKSVFPTLVK
jgi:hypothetical protein